MKKITFAIFLFILTPFVSNAYTTTDQSVTDLGDRTGLFQIEYRFAHGKYDVHMPILAKQSDKKLNSALSYEIRDRHGIQVHGRGLCP